MTQKILAALSVALLLGVSPSAIAQSSTPLIPPTGGAAAGGQTSTGAGASTSTGAGAGSSTSTGADAGGQTSAGAGASAGSDAGASAGSSSDAGGSSTQQTPDAGASGGADAGAAGGADAGAALDAGAQAGSQTNAGASADTNVSVDVSSEQQTEIHQAITEVNVEPVTTVDFDVSVGVAVPKTVVLNPLPPTVIKIVPQFEGYLFFLLPDGRIVIVEPDTLHIVYILS
jgi:hypothetical protein